MIPSVFDCIPICNFNYCEYSNSACRISTNFGVRGFRLNNNQLDFYDDEILTVGVPHLRHVFFFSFSIICGINALYTICSLELNQKMIE